MPDILGIGSSALTAYRKQLEATGSNIVNANTEGYKRRTVALRSSGDSSMLPTSAPSISGSGVNIDRIVRASDQYLEQQLLTANSSFQKSQVLSNGLARVEGAIFAMENNLNEAAQAFYNRASDISNNPESMPARYSFIDAGERLASEFNRVHKNITSEINGADGMLESTIKLVNVITQQISEVNKGLDRRFANSQPASDLLDQRDLLLSDLSELIDISLISAPSGSVKVYLGDTPIGTTLVTETAKLLGIDRTSDKINLVFDPYTSPISASRLNGGVVSGLLNLREQFIGLRDIVDRLSLGMSTSINQQHIQGIDMNNRPGGALFSTETLKATPSGTNLGSAQMTIHLTNQFSLDGAGYTASYSALTKNWTVKSDKNNEIVTASNDLKIDGMIFSFNGIPKDGDSFSAQPLRNSAGAMKFIITDVTSIAAGLSINVDSNSNNALQSELSVTDSSTKTQTPPPSSLGDLLNNATSGEISVKRDGVAYSLLSGSVDTEVISLGQLSALNFRFDPSEITSKLQPPVNGRSLQLSLVLNKNTSLPININMNIQSFANNLQALASEINHAAAGAGYGRNFFANVSEGILIINGLGENTVNNGTLSGPDYNGIMKTYSASEQVQLKAAEINLFSTEGRQLTGTNYTTGEASALLTQNNGFNSQAKYQAIPVEKNYKNLNISSLSSPLVATKNIDGSDQVKVNLFPRFDSAQSSGIVNAAAGSVLSMRVDGIPSVMLAGDVIAGKDNIDVATILQKELNTRGINRSWTGGLIDLSASNVPVIPFNISLDGISHDVIFTRTKDQNGNLTGSGTFQVQGGLDLRVALETEGGMKRVVIIAPPSLSANAPNVLITGGASLGLSTIPLQARVSAQGTSTAKALTFVGNAANVTAEPINFTLNGVSYSTAAVNFSGNEAADVASANAALVARINSITGFVASASTTGPVVVASTTNKTFELTINPGSANTVTQSISTFVPKLKTVSFIGHAANSAAEVINFSLNGVTYATSAVNFTGNEAADVAAANAALVTKINTISGFTASAGTTGPVTISTSATQNIELSISAGSVNTFNQVTSTVPVTLKMQTSTLGGFDLVIDKAAGTSANNAVSWKFVNDRLVLTSLDQSLRFNIQTIADKAAAEALGFSGTDLKVSRLEDKVSVSSSILETSRKLVDTLDSVSRVGYVVKIDKPITEDLIVAIKGPIDGQRVLASRTAQPIVRSTPKSLDIRVKVLSTGDQGQVEIFDALSGESVATRKWKPGESINYLDLTFRLNTAARSGDEFQVTRDKVRTLDNRNALLMSELRTERIFAKDGGTFQEAYSLAASKFGADVQSAAYTAESTKKYASDIKSVLEGKTGVNLDNEASDLIRYQQAYQAAAQVVNAARDMFQAILNIF